MKHSNNSLSQSGATGLTVLLILMLVIIGVLGTVLWMRTTDRNAAPVTANADHPIPTENAAPTRPAGDGLPRADETTQYPLDDFGAGIAQIDIFFIDINGDGHRDKITRTRVENGTDHYSDKYTIELRGGPGGAFIDITPPDFETIIGAECALQKLQFIFRPTFRVVKVSRPWRQSWITPTLATKTVYSMTGDRLIESSRDPIKEICDVSDLL
ncbi:MAG: hypothetical protein K2L95_05250 [Alphaproteobacteria bacterium]|nr:hypothetical protein [Alphaproteobacteria bacterium]